MEIYITKSAIAFGCFYLVYWAFIRHSPNFALNRIFILFSVIAASVIPLISIEFFRQSPIPQTLGHLVVSGIESGNVEQLPKKSFSIFSIVYISGLLIFAVRFLSGLATLLQMYRRSSIEYQKGFRMVITKGNRSPFTFFNFLFIGEKNFDPARLDELIIHEKVHKDQWHSADLILMEVICAIHWFNPVIWLFKCDLKSEHEFLADEQVVKKGIDLGRYQRLLLQSTEGLSLYLANYFNSSNLKKRLKMMNKEKSTRTRLKYVMGLPVMLLTTIILFINFSLKDQASLVPDTMPVYEAGEKAMYEKIAKTLKYPKEARSSNTQGLVYISFTVTADGEIIDIEADDNDFTNLLKEIVVVGYGNNQSPSEINRNLSVLQEESIRVIGLLERFKPGEKDGKPVSTRLTLPVTFKIG